MEDCQNTNFPCVLWIIPGQVKEDLEWTVQRCPGVWLFHPSLPIHWVWLHIYTLALVRPEKRGFLKMDVVGGSLSHEWTPVPSSELPIFKPLWVGSLYSLESRPALGVEERRYSTYLLQPFDSPPSPALLILICMQYYHLVHWVKQLTNLAKRNLMAAACPAGLLRTHIMPSWESGKGASFLGAGSSPVSEKGWSQWAALQLHTLCSQPHMAACSLQVLIHSSGPSLTLQELVRLMRFQQEQKSRDCLRPWGEGGPGACSQ